MVVFVIKAIKNRNVLFTDAYYVSARDNSWEHAGSYDLVALEKLLLSYGTLKHTTNVSYACAQYTFVVIWSYWCFSQSCNSPTEVNVAFIHSLQLEAEFVEIL